MKDYIDRMLHLTAEIAEELLSLKDTDDEITEELCGKINMLSVIANENGCITAEHIDNTTEHTAETPAKDTVIDAIADQPHETADNTDVLQPEVIETETSFDTFNQLQSTELSTAVHPTPAQLRAALTLNDVFLFQRTLFGGSSQRFHIALEEISHLDSFEDVRAYLIEKQFFDMKADEAQEFIALIAPFFHQ